MASLLPSIVLVHGAWHTPQNYSQYADALRKHGFKVLVPHLPSCSGASPPDAFLSEDIAAVRDIVEPLVQAGECVLMVMHSYGGAVGTDAVLGLTFPERKATGEAGGVVHMFYMCAYILPPGRTIFSVVEEAGMAHLWPQFVENAEDGSTFPKDPVQLFFGGVESGATWQGLQHLVRSPMNAFETETRGEAWRRVPVTYILTQQDYAVPRVYQDLMLEKVKGRGCGCEDGGL
ncbi:hypothetical protein LSUE1_G006944 [Lachnellula suecica]|uniref:AB hydrolase-1 domain-containing protein n=1 Tax=Lachnellula suecica TaxID=602035 RepID=A0A8T9CBL9_9HELO|nr:hypothetical protein LSUE1_G006944 [Lachnellula suecica]